jgi:hypothetical protein
VDREASENKEQQHVEEWGEVEERTGGDTGSSKRLQDNG